MTSNMNGLSFRESKSKWHVVLVDVLNNFSVYEFTMGFEWYNPRDPLTSKYKTWSKGPLKLRVEQNSIPSERLFLVPSLNDN